jgi:hypothetical protein
MGYLFAGLEQTAHGNSFWHIIPYFVYPIDIYCYRSRCWTSLFKVLKKFLQNGWRCMQAKMGKFGPIHKLCFAVLDYVTPVPSCITPCFPWPPTLNISHKSHFHFWRQFLVKYWPSRALFPFWYCFAALLLFHRSAARLIQKRSEWWLDSNHQPRGRVRQSDELDCSANSTPHLTLTLKLSDSILRAEQTKFWTIF